MRQQNTPFPVIPDWMIWVQCLCFSVLYAIWALPETILIRHVCLITGALLSLWIIYQYRHSFFQRHAILIWLIAALFLWATLHLLLLSNDFSAQREEYTSIWKRAAIGAIFAMGFGMTLPLHSRKGRPQADFQWVLMYVGLLAPTLIYIAKYSLTNFWVHAGLQAPSYWLLYYESSPYYLPKTVYVCFCLPTLGIALGQLVRNIRMHQLFKWANVIYLLTIPAVLFVFYAENIKNGVVYSSVLLFGFFSLVLFGGFRRYWAIKVTLVGVILIITSLFVVNSIDKNDSWKTFVADARVAKDTQAHTQWKYSGQQGYPNNDLGRIVSVTNYERIAWGKVGLMLIAKNPLGYGLVERSFGHLAKVIWPDSNLNQSHSGWIDLGLGIGIPGLLLILGILLLSIYYLTKENIDPAIEKVGDRQNLYGGAICWALFSLLIMWCTTELSQKIFFDSLIFWLSLGAGYALRSNIRCYRRAQSLLAAS